MPHYEQNFITQVVLRADLLRGTVPLAQAIDPELCALWEGFPLRSSRNLAKNEIRVEKTPQGPVRNTRTIQFTEHSFWTEDKSRRLALCGEYLLLQETRYSGYESARDSFLTMCQAVAARWPALRCTRLGMRYVNVIRLPEVSAGTGLGADFWESYVNPLLLGGLRFAANDGALARHMCNTELNYGADRAAIRYGIFNPDYPKPNRRREFVLDIDASCQQPLEAGQLPEKLEDLHRAACSVFETAVTDKLRARMRGR